ncbi:MAG: PAS domain S-box protein, partial [Planctomycetota bacterium]|nr:PAS domain S-box protein [Planctomycetota bacterium]
LALSVDGATPPARALREGRPVVCDGGLGGLLEGAHLPAARRQATSASATLPIRLGDRVAGVLSVHAPASDAFGERELALLAETADDITYALDVLAREDERQAVEARARDEQRFSRTMIESMPGIIYFYDEDGGFLRWNRNFEVVSGYSGAEIGRMHPLDFFEGDDKPRVEERIREVFTRGEAWVEAPFRAKDGRTTPFFFTGRRVTYEGKPCLVGMGIDVSERRRAQEALERSEQRFRRTLDNVLEGCQLIDFEWRYLYLNDAAARHNRRPNAELIGRRMPDEWPGIEGTEVFRMLRRCLEERVAHHEEVEFPFPDGTAGWFDVRVQPVPEGIFVLSIDITERRRAQQALLALNQTLEAQVAERTTELAAALVRAEAADRLKSAFLATMSHELRTPLNSIIGFTGIVLQELAGPLTPEQHKQLSMVRTSARHLLDLINDVLDLSKIEAGQLEVRAEPFDLAASVERVVAMVKPLADRKGLTLTVAQAPGSQELVSDRRRVEQILLNLLNNAVKFTDRGGVTLSVEEVEAQTGPAVRLRVKDTGIGLSPEDLVSLFQPFRQLDHGLARQHEGTGLGLAICRRLATLLGGEITATGEPLHGSEFTVALPRRRSA